MQLAESLRGYEHKVTEFITYTHNPTAEHLCLMNTYKDSVFKYTDKKSRWNF